MTALRQPPPFCRNSPLTSKGQGMTRSETHSELLSHMLSELCMQRTIERLISSAWAKIGFLQKKEEKVEKGNTLGPVGTGGAVLLSCVAAEWPARSEDPASVSRCFLAHQRHHVSVCA